MVGSQLRWFSRREVPRLSVSCRRGYQNPLGRLRASPTRDLELSTVCLVIGTKEVLDLANRLVETSLSSRNAALLTGVSSEPTSRSLRIVWDGCSV